MQHDDPIDRRVLFAEPETGLRVILGTALDIAGFDVEQTSDGTAVLSRIADLARQGTAPDVLVLDGRLADLAALDIVEAIRDRGLTTPCVLIGRGLDPAMSARAAQLGVVSLKEPFHVDDLLRLVAHARRRGADGPLGCASCGGANDLRAADEEGSVFFCDECRRRKRNEDLTDPLVDLGRGD